jgi:hypothetical protein
MNKSIAGEAPIAKINDGNYVTIQIIPEKIKFSVYARPKPLNNDEIFDSLGWYELNVQ